MQRVTSIARFVDVSGKDWAEASPGLPDIPSKEVRVRLGYGQGKGHSHGAPWHTFQGGVSDSLTLLLTLILKPKWRFLVPKVIWDLNVELYAPAKESPLTLTLTLTLILMIFYLTLTSGRNLSNRRLRLNLTFVYPLRGEWCRSCTSVHGGAPGCGEP